jgi:3-phenylpropionate/cinnamic acid dioxygenase small subunit
VTSFETFHAITNLLYRYAECIDGADFDGIAALFTHATMTNEGFPGEIRGGDAIAAVYRNFNKVHADGTLRTRHLTTNTIIDADERIGTATSRCSFVVLQATDLVPLQPIVFGRYHDRFARTDGLDGLENEWRFEHRHIVMDAMGDVSDHLLIDVDRLRE